MEFSKTINYKKLVSIAAILLGFIVMGFLYVSPVMEGKVLSQHDVLQYQGMAKEATDYAEKTGEPQLWTNSMFGGMPTYLIKMIPDNLVYKLHKLYTGSSEHPQWYLIAYFVFAFLALLLLDFPIWLAMLGALLYGFSSYFYIILEAGHLTKIGALGYMPLVIAAVFATYRMGKLHLGSAVFGLSLALQLAVNHLQITYYTAIVCVVLAGFMLYEAIKAKAVLKKFILPSCGLLAGLLFAVGSNFCTLYMTYDYGKESMRGKSELTDNQENKTSGLDIDYATAWSYGIAETIDLVSPNFMGGASSGELSTNSEVYKELKRNGMPQAEKAIKNMPTYWGEQPITSGPVYIGAIVFFLFVFGLLYVTGTVKWWLAIVTLLSILLAWGHNFMPLTEFFLNFVPGYNKFRTVSMILVIAEFAMPCLAIIALKQFFADNNKAAAFKKMLIAFCISAGFLLILLITSGMWSFQGQHDSQMLPDWLLPAIQADRKHLMQADLWRSILFIAASFGTLALFRFGKTKTVATIAILSGFVIADMWTVNKRYLNNDDFVKQKKSAFRKTPANIEILRDKDPNFRVMNLTVSPFNDASTSYFHKSIGGYHGAKMKRYQELIDAHLSQMNMDVYNMLNTKYFIVDDQRSGKPIAQLNPDALGNAWFVKSIRKMPNADAEIAALNDFNPAQEAMVDMRFNIQNDECVVDSSAKIQLTSYQPMELQYESHNANAGVAIFSEIYYDKGWNAYIDGEFTPHFRANYVLRGLEIPAGNHKITFKFEPQSYYVSNTISLVFSSLLLLGFVAICGWEVRKKFVA